MGCVYKMTNNKNGMIYIGCTTQSLVTRMNKHRNDDIKCNTLLGQAIREFGWESFSYECLEEIEDRKTLFEAERHYIELLHSYAPEYPDRGYNMTRGGVILCGEDNPFYGRKHSDKNRAKISIIQSQRTGEANPFYGRHHTDTTKSLIKAQNSKSVLMLNESGAIIKCFQSRVDAAQWVREQGITNSMTVNSTIGHAIKKGIRAYGYYWQNDNQSVETMEDECTPVG